ncbi:nuclear transport factor 2 family protein [Haloarchaeobius sp. FL176]|uniref:nuclear transport factor 2 family protein n=1 Tax=Haloarchaeobius sp. FL176 TaxID=2967129 RepID=UPI002147B866|nr:nuclear transport factor 2 family protein [Haloarchaeobius sp. FL176]
MTPEETVLDYYEALRRGEPLYPYFVERAETWKAAISTQYSGYDAVSEALREQSRTTDEWTVESEALSVTGREGLALFDDAVRLAWTDTLTGQRHGFDSRWSGALEPLDGNDEEWGFIQMHVSAPRSI